MSIKVVRIIARLNIGGPARNAVILTKELSCKGFDTKLVCGEVSKGEGDMRYIASEQGIRPIIIKNIVREVSFKKDWPAFWSIFKILWREKPDIIHTHTAKAGALGRFAGIAYNLINVILRRNKRCRIVHTFHGHVLHSYFGKYQTIFFILVERCLAVFTDKIVVVSNALKKELVEKFHIASNKKFEVVELGFELDDLLKLPQKEDTDTIVIGTVGRLTSVKNQIMLFKVAHNFKTLNLNKKVKFVIVGEGELGEELDNYVNKLGINDIVEFRGWVKTLPYIYKDMDIVVLTSLNEGTPVSIIEGMAAGRPILATKVGGVMDVVEDGRSGYLVESNNTKDFTERLMLLVMDRDRRKAFGQYGRKFVEKRFSKERLINDMEKLYNNILKIEEKK